MSLLASDVRRRRRNQNAYTCTDGLTVTCRYDVARIGGRHNATVPRNGILLKLYASPTTVIAGTWASRDMNVIIRSGKAKTYAFPSTVLTVDEYAFYKSPMPSVRLNEGLKALEENSF